MQQSVGVTVDIVIFRFFNRSLQVLLIRRGIPPYKNSWALPGGFVKNSESLDAAALRELEEEAGVKDVYLEQLFTFGDVKRDPRGRIISVTYFALTREELNIKAGTDASEACWYSVYETPKLAFDHDAILKYAFDRLRSKLEWTTVGFNLLPDKFTLSDLQNVYEVVLGKVLDKRNFRRRIKMLGYLKPLKEYRQLGFSRSAQLFQFRKS